MKIWLAIILGTAVTSAVLWMTELPLGIPDEWTWSRTFVEPDTLWNFVGGVIAAGLFIGFILLGRRRFETTTNLTAFGVQQIAWLCALVPVSFAWIWIVQEVSPLENRLGKSSFVLYYPSSSGYFTRARYDQPDPGSLLAGYEKLMREGDVLHTGTHPPGLFLVFHGLIGLCQRVPQLTTWLESFQAPSFREACDIINTNLGQSAPPQALSQVDRQVLWLATLLVMLAAAATVVPLYGLLVRTCSPATAWSCAALWPTMPAVTIFVPKSDVAFPFFGVLLLWLWMTAWDRRSFAFAFLAGVVTWCSLMCSLAFLPCVLVAALLTIGTPVWNSICLTAKLSPRSSTIDAESAIDWRRWGCIIAAGLGFILPTCLLWVFAQINMLNVWFMNYRNHAAFYRQYARSYGKWLLVNPVELTFAAGWPLMVLALLAIWRVLGRTHVALSSPPSRTVFSVVGSLVSVWGLLWITGKNSGEAARLWIVFLPWLNWLASIEFDYFLRRSDDIEVRQHRTGYLAIWQFAACLLTAMRVSGFRQ